MGTVHHVGEVESPTAGVPCPALGCHDGEVLRRTVKAVLPEAMVQRARQAKHHMSSRQHDRVAVAVRAATSNVVAEGPFAGMKYPTQTSWGAPSPNLIGSYESELHGVIETVIHQQPATIVDVGAADGYYAVGLARRLPQTKIVAFDIAKEARIICCEMAAKNRVAEQVSVRGECTAQELDRLCVDGAVLIMDCEGAESELIDFERVPGLARTMIIVETHEFVVPGVTSAILSRARLTHEVSLIETTRKQRMDWKVTRRMGRIDASIALSERRRSWPHPQQWAILTPRASTA